MIVLNIASLLPRAAFQPEWAAQVAKTAGYAGISILPFRGWQKRRNFDLSVFLVEPAWNPGNLRGFLRGLAGNLTAPKIHDIVFFPKPEKCDVAFQQWLGRYGPKPIFHSWTKFWQFWVQRRRTPFLEISPGLWQRPEEILSGWLQWNFHREIEKPNKIFVLDLCHLRRQARPNEVAKRFGQKAVSRVDSTSRLGPWRQAMEVLLPYTGLIDFQALSVGELFATLDGNGKKTELREMVLFAKGWGYAGPWRVEFNLGFLNQLDSNLLAVVARDAKQFLEKV